LDGRRKCSTDLAKAILRSQESRIVYSIQIQIKKNVLSRNLESKW